MLSETILKDAKSVPQTIGYKIKYGIAGLQDQEEALKEPETAYLFALSVPGADIKKCQNVACKDSNWAWRFAMHVL